MHSKAVLRRQIVLGTLLLALRAAAQQAATPVYTYQVVKAYPHDPAAFTQGLIFLDGFLYEGTGLNGRSGLRKVNLDSGRVVRQKAIEEHFFGEGITEWGDELIQLTWQSGVGFVWDRETFQRKRQFKYGGEGWGITHDSQRLIMSDGSPVLRFWDPKTQAETGRIVVLDGRRPVANLNELEWVKGEIWANVWQTFRVARISPRDGRVLGWIDFSGILGERDSEGVDVMNGIAYDAKKDRLFVTGKLWPKIFEVKILPR